MEPHQWLLAIASGVTAVGVIWRKAVKPVVERIAYIEGEFKNNGGSSMRDGLDQVMASTARIEQRQHTVMATLEAHGDRLTAIEEVVTAPPPRKKAAS